MLYPARPLQKNKALSFYFVVFYWPHLFVFIGAGVAEKGDCRRECYVSINLIQCLMREIWGCFVKMLMSKVEPCRFKNANCRNQWSKRGLLGESLEQSRIYVFVHIRLH